MATLSLQLVTPERTVFQNREVDSVSCPTTLGQITVLPGHAALVAELEPGELIIRDNKGENPLHVAGGFIEVKSENKVNILADVAEHVEEIDEASAQKAKELAEKAMRESVTSNEEYAVAASNLERSLSRLRFVRKHAHTKQRPITSEGVLKE